MEEFILIGTIIKPQGVRGELKVKPLTDSAERFNKLKEVYIDNNLQKLLGVRINAQGVFVAISGITDRNEAEKYRNKSLFVKREDAVSLPQNRFFIVDILGSALFNDAGEKIGEIVDVFNSKTDIFTVKCLDGRILRFPFLKDLLVKVDATNKAVTVKKKRLDEVSCYED